jgi:transposase
MGMSSSSESSSKSNSESLFETTHPPALKTYSSDVSEAEWEFCAPYLILMDWAAPQWVPGPRGIFNGLRCLVKTGSPWRYLPFHTVYQQASRWIKADCFEHMAYNLRGLLRLLVERNPSLSAAILDGRTLQSVPENGARADYDRYRSHLHGGENGFCRLGLQRAGTAGPDRGTGHLVSRVKLAEVKKRLRAFTSPQGGRAVLCPAGAFPSSGQR